MKIKLYDQFIAQRQSDNLYRNLPNDVHGMINFSSNDYLGLSKNTDILEVGYKIAQKYGVGAGASRFVTGNNDFFIETEAKLAAFKKRQAAFFGVSGYQINMSIIPALLNADLFDQPPLVIFDKFNHASMYQAVQLSKTELVRFKHNNFNHLEHILNKYASSKRQIFIMTEAVYSMDGDMCDLDILVQLAQKYDAITLVDEAHSTGILGPNGSGLASKYPEIDIIIGTASKAFGIQGGYVVCSQKMMDYFYNSAKGMIYSTAVSPFIWGCLDKVLDLMPQLNQSRQDVSQKADYLRVALNKLNMSTLNSVTHIVPMICENNAQALFLENKLFENNIIAKAIRSPTVPFALPRLRLTLNPHITYGDIDFLIQTLREHI